MDIRVIHDRIKTPALGIVVSKHFVERFYERFHDYEILKESLAYAKNNVCELIYRAATREDGHVNYTLLNRNIKVGGFLETYVTNGQKHPVIKLSTIYTMN